MINLLPDNNKKAIHAEYKLRLHIVWLTFIVIVLGGSIILLVPSYFLSLYKSKAAEFRVITKPSEAQAADRVALEAKMRDTKLTIRALGGAKATTKPSSSITLITKNKPTTISITEIIYSVTEENKSVTTVRGLAKTRQALLDFTTALRKETGVEKVDLPVSNFAKDTNIPFSFEVTAKL